MSRRLRFVPEGGALMEVTDRTVHGRYLLVPSQELNEIIIGALARAQQHEGVRCCALSFVSTHYHLLLDVDDAEQLSRFMCRFNSKLAREVARLYDWPDKVWSRRYQAIAVSEEEGAQAGRLAYVLAHGVKENLVEHARDWPGVHAVRALLDGEILEGLWFDRTQEYAAKQRGEPFGRLQYATPETLTLAPLPCWKHLDPDSYRRCVAGLVETFEAEAAATRRRSGIQVAGPAAVVAYHPHTRPEKLKKGPAPLFHAFSKEMRQFLYESYRLFVAAFRDAAEALKAGNRKAPFPKGCFPPALPFVGG